MSSILAPWSYWSAPQKRVAKESECDGIGNSPQIIYYYNPESFSCFENNMNRPNAHSRLPIPSSLKSVVLIHGLLFIVTPWSCMLLILAMSKPNCATL